MYPRAVGIVIRGRHKPGSVSAAGIRRPALRWQPFVCAACCQTALAANPGLSARNTPTRLREREAPIWPCSGWGLPCGPCCQRPGALLPHPFTLACAPAASSTGHRRYTLCGTFPELQRERQSPAGVTRHPCFVEPGLSSHGLPRTRLPQPPDPHQIGDGPGFGKRRRRVPQGSTISNSGSGWSSA